MSERFAGHVALVTGAASGIGAACVARLVAEGARVLLVDRSDDVLVQAERLGAAATALHMDVSDEDAWSEAARLISARHGRLDVVVNAAGITESGREVDCAHLGLTHLRRVMSVNLESAIVAWRVLLPLLSVQGGSVVNIASRAARVGVPSAPAYAASKAALVSFTKSAALQGARLNPVIRCNAVLPGSVDTPMWRPLGGDGGERERAEAIAAGLPHVPLGRLATPGEIAAVAVFLAGPEASYVTGAAIPVDGGQCAT